MILVVGPSCFCRFKTLQHTAWRGVIIQVRNSTLFWYHYFVKKTRLFILFVISLLILNGCSVIQKIQFSQDKLPWKSSGDILLEDDFSDDTTGWEIINNVYELKGYSSAGYLISINNQGGRSISTTGLQFTDSKIQVETHKLTGSNDSYLGIICRYQDNQNYYRFFVTPDGYTGIVRVVNGESSTLPVGKMSYNHDVLQDDGINLLEVSCVGNQLKLMVNNKLAVSAEDDQLKQGDVGLFAETGQNGPGSFIFNQFIVTKP